MGIYTTCLLVFMLWLFAISDVISAILASKSSIGIGTGLHNFSVNHESSPLDKRWYINEDNSAYGLWPMGHIKVCFEDKNHMHGGQIKSAERILKSRLEAARKLWANSGLDERDFNFEMLPVNHPLCNDASQRREFLLVLYAGEGVERMATSVGQQKVPHSDNTFETGGSKMVLSDSLQLGMKNVVANFAHEMGHAWGMLHEHQNYRWWQNDNFRGTADEKGYFFGKDSFFCEKLRDYEATVIRINTDAEFAHYDRENKRSLIREMCRDRNRAKEAGFDGAFNWLPAFNYAQGDESRKEPDWNSIMTYPSDGGGIRTSREEHETVMLKKPKDGKIKPVFRPSSSDIKGLYYMYGKPTPFIPTAIQRTASGLMDRIRKLDSPPPS